MTFQWEISRVLLHFLGLFLPSEKKIWYISFNREFCFKDVVLVHFCFNAQIDVSVTKNCCSVIYLKTGFYFCFCDSTVWKKEKKETGVPRKMAPWWETLIRTVILNEFLRSSWQCSLTVVLNYKSVKATLWFILSKYVRPRSGHIDHELSPELGIGNKWS